jgi:hypothetical protein
MKTKQLTEKDVTFRLTAEPDQQSPRGNALASGDDEEDRKCEDEILRRIDEGDVWAWCVVKVEAHYHVLVGVDYLGGCSYKDEADFREPGGYFDDMKGEALADLQRQFDDLAPHSK